MSLEITALLVIILAGFSNGYATMIMNITNPCYKTPSPCQNGGTCVIYYRSLYKCICPDNTYGQKCENAALTGTTVLALTSATECATYCEIYNKRGSLQCTGSQLNGTHCLLSTQPTAYTVSTRVGTVKTCANYKVAMLTPQPDGNFGASSNHASSPPYRVRLDTTNTAAWAAWRNADGQFWNQWLQVYFGTNILATGLTFQARYDCCNEWVRRAKIYYHSDINGGQWNWIADSTGFDRVFSVIDTKTWTDKQAKVNVDLDFPIIMNYLRVYPLAYNEQVALRMEVWGCSYATN